MSNSLTSDCDRNGVPTPYSLAPRKVSYAAACQMYALLSMATLDMFAPCVVVLNIYYHLWGNEVKFDKCTPFLRLLKCGFCHFKSVSSYSC